MTTNVLILGINGFIGSHLAEQILEHTTWHLYGMDIRADNITGLLTHPRLHFTEGDITIQKEWVEYHIKKCDVVLPLAAIANPSVYVHDPLRVFELDFRANLAIVDLCVKYQTRIVFPSTSEVYGMSPDTEFNEETSNLVLGPVQTPRWIYSCSKQLLDRVIYAHGKQGLKFTLFRPFNWVGPRLDNILDPKEGSSRAFTQFLGSILRGNPISLVNGGTQRRSFTYVGDGINALLKIIENKNACADGRILNIGNPDNNHTVRELAEMMIAEVKTYPTHKALAERTELISVASDDYYGKGYQDVALRVPSIKLAHECLGWQPTTDIKTAIRKTLDHYLTK